MAAVGKYIHSSIHTGLSISATNAYVAAQRHPLPLNNDQTGVNGNVRGIGVLGALYVHVNTIAGGATTLTLRLSTDAAGDNPWIGDTTATISTGITTATQGAVTIKMDVPFIKNANDILYCHWKTNAGTCTVDAINLTWTE
jgi:hypothetical protein